MKEIEALDEAVFDASPATLFAAVRDEVVGRSAWWRPALELLPRPGTPAGREGAVFDVFIPGRYPVRFTGRIARIVENESVDLDYVGGDFLGTGRWTFEPVDDATLVRFLWRVRPNGRRMRLAAHLMNVGHAHSAVVRRGFDGLRRYLRAQRARRLDAPAHPMPSPPDSDLRPPAEDVRPA